MFDIAWSDKYDLSALCLLYFINNLISRESLPHLLFLIKIIVTLYEKEIFVTFYIAIRMFP